MDTQLSYHIFEYEGQVLGGVYYVVKSDYIRMFQALQQRSFNKKIEKKINWNKFSLKSSFPSPLTLSNGGEGRAFLWVEPYLLQRHHLPSDGAGPLVHSGVRPLTQGL